MFRSITPVVLGLLVVNVAIHLAAVFITDNDTWNEVQERYMRLQKVDTFGLHKYEMPPGTPKFHPLQPLGASFAHDPVGLYHIVLNMLCLFFFGPSLERRMGSLPFLGLYFFCAIVGGFIGAYGDTVANPSLGASGAICGLLVAFAWLFPGSRMGLMFIPVFIPSRIFTGLFAAISLGLVIYAIGTGRSFGGISHSGHLAGMIAGVLFMIGYAMFAKDKQSPDSREEEPEEVIS